MTYIFTATDLKEQKAKNLLMCFWNLCVSTVHFRRAVGTL